MRLYYRGRLLFGLVLAASSLQGTARASDILLDIPPGYGTPRVLYVRGRAYRIDEEAGEFVEKVPTARLKKAVSTVILFFPQAEGDEAIKLKAGDVKDKVKTDGEGYFDAEIHAPRGTEWRGRVRVRIDAGCGEDFRGTVYVPDPAATLGIISDIDDTIKRTGVRHKSKVAREILFGDASTDKAVPGMAPLYNSIVNGGEAERPVHYVTGSPGLLASRIVEFLALNGFPPGSLDLMRLGSPKSFIRKRPDLGEYKTGAIGRILDTFPDRKFILFGDAGQKDPAVYSRLASRYPGRIAAIYIRRVEKGVKDEGEYPLCFFFTAPDEVRNDLVERGIIGGRK